MIKFFEIRDRATCIFAFATCLIPKDYIENWMMRRSGYADAPVFLTRLDNGSGSNDPYSCGLGSRTMSAAHKYIRDNFDHLDSGDVIDVEFILGETKEKKKSERFE